MSSIGISCCVGAIEGILIWIHKPSDSDCDMLGFGQTKFFCGRKKKFGLNMQAVCDAKRQFLWVDIRYPGTTSDFFAFDQSSLKDKLEQPGFLHSGLCLFGDAAYANSPYMCSPFVRLLVLKMTSTSFRVNCVSPLNVRSKCLSIDLEYFGRRFQ